MSEEFGVDNFVKQLEKLGYVPAVKNNKVVIEYEIPCGRFQGRKIKLGFEVPPDFSVSPPSGPHMAPQLLPLNPEGEHPAGRIHQSPFSQEFEDDWEYWSRPITNHWARTDRSVRVYLNYMEHLFKTQ